jgi:hypothetical protein
LCGAGLAGVGGADDLTVSPDDADEAEAVANGSARVCGTRVMKGWSPGKIMRWALQCNSVVEPSGP